MSEVLRGNRTTVTRQLWAVIVVTLFCGITYMPMVEASPNRQVQVDILVEPNGVSDNYSIQVPDGEIVTSLDFEMLERSWPIDDVVTLQDEIDWMNGAVMDGIDYNLTGLRILPMSHEWDFEGGVQGWTLSSSGGWAHGYDSTLGATNGVHSGSSAIYTYNGNYPSNLGSTYWATSPSVDCSSCTGTWDLKFWKRLGVESNYYDHAYVSVKNTAGGWTNVYSNPSGTVNDGSYTQSSYDISSYVANNPAFQVRFGIGSSDYTVQYTGWNIDDVTIEPRGNTGTGTANWTSQPFGPSGIGKMSMEHGLLAIDAEVPQGSLVKWSLIDSVDGSVIPGFLDIQEMSADLSVIDTHRHPSVQLKIQMETNSETPIIRSIKLGGGIIEPFTNANPVGWSGFSSQSNGVVSGTDSLTSPEWRLSRPFSAMELNFVGTGTGNFEACFEIISDCTASWNHIGENGIFTLEHPSSILNLRWNGSGSYSIDHLEIDLHRQSSPNNARIDVGMDGVYEWSFPNQVISKWGLQDMFESGNTAQELTISPGGSDVFSLNYPIKTSSSDDSYQSKGNMMFSLSAINSPLDGVEFAVSVGGIEVFTDTVGFIMNSKTVVLSDSQTQDIISEFESRTPDHSVIGDLDAHKIEVSVSSNSGGDLLVSGLSVPYRYDIRLGDDVQPVISSINSQLSNINAINSVKEVSIPVIMDNPGSVLIREYDLQTLGSPQPTGITMSNQTETLVAGEVWYEFNSSFDLSVLGIQNAQQHFIDELWSSSFTLSGSKWSRSVECSVTSEVCNVEQGVLLQDFTSNFAGSSVEFNHRIQLSAVWPNEEAMIVKSSINMNGPLSQANELRFGLGSSMAVQQDIEVVDWHLSFLNGAQSTWDALYFDPANPGVVEVELSFIDLGVAPRSNSVNIGLYVDGMLSDTTQNLVDGVATLSFNANPANSELSLSVVVTGLYGQNVEWNVPKNATFLIDETAPTLVSSNIAPLDHRSNEFPLGLEFVISDRPRLPRHSVLHVESSWSGEDSIQLDQPANLNGFQGVYSTIIDVRDAQVGDTMSGWLEVFDPAGHSLPNSGTEERPMFIISFGPDGAPVIQTEGLGWSEQLVWVHPGQNYSMQIPVVDSNGYGDIESIEVDLSSNTNEEISIEWNPQSGCNSSHASLIVANCSILGETDHFDSHFTLQLTISFGWDFNPDSSIERDVQVTVRDDSGQSSRSDLISSWKYSSEIQADLGSAGFVDSTEFSSPGDSTKFKFNVIWTKSSSLVMSNVDFSVTVGANPQYAVSETGFAIIDLVAPNESGIHPITINLENLPMGAIDRTDSSHVVSWMVVDSNQPRVLGLVSPESSQVVQERDWKDLRFEFMINETEGLDLDSLEMNWMILPSGMLIPELAVLEGNTSMSLIAGTGSGMAIPVSSILDIESIIPEVSRQNAWDLWIWIEGQDLAGQNVDPTFNNRASPLTVLQLANRDAQLRLDSEDIQLSSESPVTNKPVIVNITVHNDGQVEGTTSVRIEAVEDGDNRRLVEIVNIVVPASSSVSFEVKWTPKEEGAAWLELTTPNGMFERTTPTQVAPDDSSYVIESLEGANSSMLTGFGIIMFLMVGLLGFLIITGKKSEEDFDESEFI